MPDDEPDLEARVLEALRPIVDPELRRSIVELGMVRTATVRDGVASIEIALTTPGCPIRSQFEQAVREALAPIEGVTSVDVSFGVLDDAERAALQQRLGRAELPDGALAEVGMVVCVASGKGGVGKSTLSMNLAAAMHARGHTVGVLDADVWGYSLPRMLGIREKPTVSPERKLIPPRTADGMSVMSIGFFIEEDSAVVWRGPMLHKVLAQFLQDVAWGSLDVLVVDLPPGTGDVSISLAELLPQARFVIVTTPQAASHGVARRAARMATGLEHELVGVIENMSDYVDDTGRHHAIFGSGGGAALAQELDVPLLGQIPLTVATREQADDGQPVVVAHPEDPAAAAIDAVAGRLLALRPQKPLPMAMAAAAPTEPSGPAAPPGRFELPVVQA
ncbi:Mrp/NBP35 family ATP-binding protein [Paraconexibacter sp.]|uniref:Mrp/NBP35 family ATP-binding protein n=1 Tax=Paraconexibacter sp. TaxID=2949640 RepID=UPI003568CCFC